MSDSKTNSTQLDGLSGEASGFDEGGASKGDKSKTKSRASKPKAKPAADNSPSKAKSTPTSGDGYTTTRRVWPD